MRITEIREKTVPIASRIANAFIDFSKMTCSIVAVTTDVIRNGQPLTGYGFNSKPAIHSITSSKTSSPGGIQARWLQAKICSRCKMLET